LRSISILSSHLCLGLQSGLSPSRSPTKMCSCQSAIERLLKTFKETCFVIHKPLLANPKVCDIVVAKAADSPEKPARCFCSELGSTENYFVLYFKIGELTSVWTATTQRTSRPMVSPWLRKTTKFSHFLTVFWL
jgi:hypothetical protein